MRALFASLFIVIVDQITKLYIKGFNIPALHLHHDGMIYGDHRKLIGNFLRITFVENPGIAFGIDLGISSKLFLSLFSIAASIGIIYYLYKVRNDRFILRFALALILGGAVGNLIDRVFYGVFYGYAPLFFGKVVDFIDVDFFDVNFFGYTYDRWPIFNVADMAVSIGVLLLVAFSFKTKPAAQTEEAETLQQHEK
ncbi:MAG TPA: signal peptidase II [Ignavibacteriales bacterium]|nr:signal peptidase II [Ignavibacteriales bacterium]